jgi:hypothetical protein
MFPTFPTGPVINRVAVLRIRFGFNADPNTDPDPAFLVKANPGTDPGSGSRVLMTKNWKKITADKKIIFLSKIAIYLSLGLHKGRSRYRRSHHPSKENI